MKLPVVALVHGFMLASFDAAFALPAESTQALRGSPSDGLISSAPLGSSENRNIEAPDPIGDLSLRSPAPNLASADADTLAMLEQLPEDRDQFILTGLALAAYGAGVARGRWGPDYGYYRPYGYGYGGSYYPYGRTYYRSGYYY